VGSNPFFFDVFGQEKEPICNTIHAITSFHYMASVLVSVGATIHKIIQGKLKDKSFNKAEFT